MTPFLVILKLLIWPVIVIGGNLAWHIYEIVKKKQKPDYVLTWFYRGMLMGLFIVLMTIKLSDVVELDYFAPLFVYCITTYVLFFNPSMNALKNKFADAKPAGFWYLGKTSGYFWDDFWIKNLWLYKVVYFSSIPALLWSIYKMNRYY